MIKRGATGWMVGKGCVEGRRRAPSGLGQEDLVVVADPRQLVHHLLLLLRLGGPAQRHV